jgi:hypothetical protein
MTISASARFSTAVGIGETPPISGGKRDWLCSLSHYHPSSGSLGNLGRSESAFPIAENLAKGFLSLPMFPELTEE